MKDGDKDYMSMLLCYYVEKSDEVKEWLSNPSPYKDNANERNESGLSNCRVQLIFCKTIIK